MKKIVNLAVAILAMVVMVGCSKPDESGIQYLDVTHNNIKGTWRLESFDYGEKLAEGSYFYITFDRAERTFVSYDNTSSMELQKKSGRYDIVIDGAAVIFGDYDFGLGISDWEHRYYVRNLTTESMVWVAVDDESIRRVYVRAELPEWIPVEE